MLKVVLDTNVYISAILVGGKPEVRVQQALLDIKSITKFTNPKLKVSDIKEHDPDNRILECALKEKVDYLVSGDTKHLQPLKEYWSVKILSPADFLETLLRE